MKARQSQQGVALVITLILLSVITFMAVTFLVVSRKEASQVNTLQQQSNAKFAADAANAEAVAQISAQMLASGNGLNFGLVVSTNFQSGTNFQNSNPASNPAYTNITNVTYSMPAGASSADLIQMLNNLQILPRPPVFIVTNKLLPNNPDFRFYLDLNRNGRYDTNGAVVEHDPAFVDPNSLVTNVYVGDPEWVGILNHPDQRHSSSNFFTERYAFIALPIGNSLDINFIHNQAKLNGQAWSDGYQRNEGVGTWEINLAAFLHTLNTNWDNTGVPYDYETNIIRNSRGICFDDATAILQYRYNNSYVNLRSFQAIYPGGYNQFVNDYVDGYTHGPLMTGLFLPELPTTGLDPDSQGGLATKPGWSGDNNLNMYFTTQDLFNKVPYPNNNPSFAAQSFSNHLYQAGRNFNAGNAPYSQVNNSKTNSYNRYTFYTMLSQLSFGSAPESSMENNTAITGGYPGYYPFTNRLNLNYCNVGVTNSTNFQAWDPLQFFTNCANRLLANAGYTNNVNNIEIYPTNYYTPAMHRLLQLAANIYDATTNHAFDNNSPNGPYYPSVFRPYFNVSTVNGVKIVSIAGYKTNNVLDYTCPPLSLPEQLASVVGGINGTTNIYGIPWVVGAKKGLPNFNEFSMDMVSLITRKLQVVNKTPGTGSASFQTNVQYSIGLSNVMAVEAWNSYTNFYPRAVDLIGADTINAAVYVTNTPGGAGILLANVTFTNGWNYTIDPSAGNFWLGATLNLIHQPNTNSFRIPLMTNVIFLTNSVYHPNIVPHLSPGTNFDTGPNATTSPHFVLYMTNYLRYIMLDHPAGGISGQGRVIDYAHFNGMTYQRDLTAELQGTDNGGNGGVWKSNAFQPSNPLSMTTGIANQIMISEGLGGTVGFLPTGWINDSIQGNSIQSETGGFQNFLAGNGGITNSMQAPYTPTRVVSVYYTWQANDPLVHYTLGDLVPQPAVQANITTNYINVAAVTIANSNLLQNIGLVNQRYLPWGNTGNAKGVHVDNVNAFNVAVKDPQVINSDCWQFPTNKFPNIGWLGRVHRGTPWQTVYLKSLPEDLGAWTNWTGNMNVDQFGLTNNPAGPIYSGNFIDASLSLPTNDWSLMNLFTTAPNDNATRGQLSVNQTGTAAWAALLDGLIVLSNTAIGGLTNVVIDPNTNLNAFVSLINGIANARGAFPGGVFATPGQILATPQLTTQSPYLNLSVNKQGGAYPNEIEMEWIPQQIMSLLRVGSPRYVIFAYGQSLMPADHSIVQSGPQFGMCTNYQITGEIATRTVVRIDNPPVPGRAATSPPRAVVESFNVLPPE